MFIHNCFQKVHCNKFAVFILGFCLLFFLSGCERKSAELTAVEEAATIIQPITGREVYRDVEDKGRTFVRTINANLFIKYEPVNDYTKEEVYEEIVTILEENNWKRDERNKGRSDYFTAFLQQSRYPLVASVSIRSDENIVTVIIENK